MHFHFRNVNDAFRTLVQVFKLGRDGDKDSLVKAARHIVSRPSRAGDVLMIEEPVTITYERPWEKVLFNSARDCNPFFHVYESLWMLAGRNDVAPLEYYNSNIGKIASDDGQTFNGAYGYRWRKSVGGCEYDLEDGQQYHDQTRYDQLNIIVDQLKRKPDSRRVVLQMWNVEDDLLKIDSTKDVCCNTHAYFLLRPLGHCSRDHQDPNCPCAAEGHKPAYVLDMTVCNRSNDLIWGMLGANVVHFAFLQEYLAGRLGVGVGNYNQFTNNLHVYKERFEPERWLEEYRHKNICDTCSGRDYKRAYVSRGTCEQCGKESEFLAPDTDAKSDEWYGGLVSPPEEKRIELFSRPDLPKYDEAFDEVVRDFVEENYELTSLNQHTSWGIPFLDGVAQPMMHAFHMHKVRDYNGANFWVNNILATDWKIACKTWIKKREEAYARRLGANESNVSTSGD